MRWIKKILGLDTQNEKLDALTSVAEKLLKQENFDNEELNYKEKFKPIYYALMHYLKDEYPNEYLKMGDELKQPVADVMKRVEEMKVLYK